jgi:hypothetical protein
VSSLRCFAPLSLGPRPGGASLDRARAGEIEGVELFRLDPNELAFVGSGRVEALDDLRVRRHKRSESLREWRANAPPRAVSLRPALHPDGTDVEGVVQLHLEHRLVRRLLSRFLSQGFASSLSRASIVIGPGAQPRVVLIGRLKEVVAALSGIIDERGSPGGQLSLSGTPLLQPTDDVAGRARLPSRSYATRWSPLSSASGRTRSRMTCWR